MVRLMNRVRNGFQRQQEEVVVVAPEEVMLLREIRDSLKNR
jgi:large-conductance mechanosensitive channel